MGVCPACRSATADGVRYCGVCGAHLGADPVGPGAAAAPGTAAAPLPRPLPLTIVAVLSVASGAVLGLVGIGAVVLGLALLASGEALIGVGGAIAVGIGAMAAALGALNLAVGVGLWRGRTWAWAVAIVFAVIATFQAAAFVVGALLNAAEDPSILAPALFAAAIPAFTFWALLHRDTRAWIRRA